MSKTAISQYSATPSSNSDVDGIDISEGCPASNLNNAQRSLMSHLKEMDDGTSALTSPSMGQLNVDNLRLDGNTISSTDTNGNITIDPDGTGDTIVASGNVGIGTSPDSPLTVQPTAQGVGTNATQNWMYSLTSGSEYDLKLNQVVSSGLVKYSFTLRNNGTSYANNLVLDRGNVGIGTASPQQLLHLKSNNPGGKIRLEMGQSGVANGDVTGEIQFYHNDASGAGVNADIKGICTSGVGAGALTFGTGTTSTTERMRIDSAGAIRLANTSMDIDNSANTATGLSVQSTGVTHIATSGNNTSLVIQRVSDTGTDNAIFFMYGSSGVGSVQVTSSSTSYNTSSDHRLKENVTATWDATTRLKQLNPVRFNFIADADTTVDGFLAHEAQTVVPEAVTGTHNEVDDDGNPVMQGIDQSKLVPLLTKALIESVAKIEELEARITALETE